MVSTSTGEMTDDSLALLNSLCEFRTREKKGKENIIPDPKNMRHLASLVADSRSNESKGVRVFARGLLDEVEGGEEIVEEAAERLTKFKLEKEWANRLCDLLDKQEAELDPSDYSPDGNDLIARENVAKVFQRIRKLLGV